MLCNNPDPAERDEVTIKVGTKSTVDLSKKTTPKLLFDIEATFDNWDKNHHPQTVDVKLLNPNANKYYHISSCNFCKEKRIFEIHVEDVRKGDMKHNYNYSVAAIEGFDLPPTPPAQDKCVIVDIWIYNSDPCVPEKYYFKCGNLSNDSLRFPKSNPDPDCEESIKAFAIPPGGIQPKHKKGAIIVGI